MQDLKNPATYDRPFELVILTDGESTDSVVTLEDAKALIRDPGVPNFHLFLIGIGLSQHGRGRQCIQVLDWKRCPW